MISKKDIEKQTDLKLSELTPNNATYNRLIRRFNNPWLSYWLGVTHGQNDVLRNHIVEQAEDTEVIEAWFKQFPSDLPDPKDLALTEHNVPVENTDILITRDGKIYTRKKDNEHAIAIVTMSFTSLHDIVSSTKLSADLLEKVLQRYPVTDKNLVTLSELSPDYPQVILPFIKSSKIAAPLTVSVARKIDQLEKEKEVDTTMTLKDCLDAVQKFLTAYPGQLTKEEAGDKVRLMIREKYTDSGIILLAKNATDEEREFLHPLINTKELKTAWLAEWPMDGYKLLKPEPVVGDEPLSVFQNPEEEETFTVEVDDGIEGFVDINGKPAKPVAYNGYSAVYPAESFLMIRTDSGYPHPHFLFINQIKRIAFRDASGDMIAMTNEAYAEAYERMVTGIKTGAFFPYFTPKLENGDLVHPDVAERMQMSGNYEMRTIKNDDETDKFYVYASNWSFMLEGNKHDRFESKGIQVVSKTRNQLKLYDRLSHKTYTLNFVSSPPLAVLNKQLQAFAQSLVE